MFRRLFYLLLGAALGGYAVYRVQRSARLLRPAGIAERVVGRVGGYRSALRELGADIHGAAEQHEAELRRRYAPAASGGEDEDRIEPPSRG